MVILERIGNVYEHGRRSFVRRPFEWFFSVITFGWGLALISPVETFAAPSYAVFRNMAPEWLWALLTFYGGLARLLVLWINGAWYRTAALRAAASFCTLLLWFVATTAFALVGTQSTGIYTYAVFFVVEFFCMLEAAYEAGRLETAQLHRLREAVKSKRLTRTKAITFGVFGIDRG